MPNALYPLNPRPLTLKKWKKNNKKMTERDDGFATVTMQIFTHTPLESRKKGWSMRESDKRKKLSDDSFFSA